MNDPHYQTPGVTLYQGDVREVLRTLPDASVQCVVTSPPYWGLRDYGTGKWEGGDPECDHLPKHARRGVERRTSTLGGGVEILTAQASVKSARELCRCGARLIDNQIGLEPTPDAYVATMVRVFRDVRRILKDDGTLWLNLGDSYAGSWGNYGARAGNQRSRISDVWHIPAYEERADCPPTASVPGLKPKDLCGIPWRVAFALQSDGWYLRSDIIWSKPNPMPESVTDRPTKAHEYLFLLAKSEQYYFDQDAVRLPYAESTVQRISQATFDQQTGGSKDGANPNRSCRRALVNLKQNQVGNRRYTDFNHRFDEQPPMSGGANIRTVWTIATQPFSEAHFATFPPKMIEPCILAGSRPGDTVLDPFNGSGTTGVVARSFDRHYIGIDLNSDYLVMSVKRLNQMRLPLYGDGAI